MKMMKIMCICIVGLTFVGCTSLQNVKSTNVPVVDLGPYNPPAIIHLNEEENLKLIYAIIETPEDSKNIECLARNMYFEARGESELGQIAVANVTVNRTEHPEFPSEICDVVHQRKQFSWTIKKKNRKPTDKKVYEDIYFIAQSVYYKQIGDVTDGALYYHTKRTKPYWSKEMTLVAMIDQHIFYKP